MDIAVLIKVVPNLERLHYDPGRKTVVREGTELFINPFDQRAVRVALDLRRPGERVTVLSMGPPPAETALRETLALGADAAVLVTDRALAGSDTLVTARVLVRALARTGHDLVLTGAWTTDSETGQVGPEVAGLLGVPVVAEAQTLRRDDAGGLEAVTDADGGTEAWRFRAPALVTVGEKIARIRKPTAAELEEAGPRPVVRLSAADLGLSMAEVGLDASPTVVATLRDDEPTRGHLSFPDGTVEERVRAAVEVLRPLVAQPPAPERAWPPLSAERDPSGEVLVLVTGREGTLHASGLAMLAEVRRSLSPKWPTAIWGGPDPTPADRDAIASAGAARILTVALPVPVDPRPLAEALRPRTEGATPPAAAMFRSHSFGRSVAALLAARRGLGLVGDAVGVRPLADGGVEWEKPSFGGGVIAGIRTRSVPSLATVRDGAFRPPPPAAPGPIESVPIDAGGPRGPGPERTGTTVETPGPWGELAGARIVLAVGMGLGGPDRLSEIAPTLARWDAALGASRRVVDAGWVPRSRQIGLTGRSVAPVLGVLVGVSGSANHLVGYRRARALLAVNPDPKAPVFRGVDAGIVGRWEEVLPSLTSAVASLGIVPAPTA